ncbi:MAG TPA: dihydrofolate reductase family protein [Candidatus Thermoplasmatota archaeon]|nr:dihydrofolate reductase family protein [Candidatus Thermoplasmatota archaeon]
MAISAFVGTSLDGFIARKDGSFDFLPADGGGESGGFKEFFASVDALVMGRNTFEAVGKMAEWPYGEKHLVVLSHRPLDLSNAPVGKAEQMAGEPAEIAKRLAARGLHRLYVDGGLTIQAFLRAGLLDRITVTTVPVLVGQGIPLFGPLAKDVKLRLVSTKPIAYGLVQSVYEVVR